ncbi:PKD domain-containing protein [Candidatus Woesearchaeota archaeon]|nr:PKD domain-containing protein [Candidatus Woesearchaeota archaeon]
MSALAIAIIFLIALPVLVSSQVDEFTDITLAAAGTPSQEYKATQLPAEVGEPVQWVKQVDIQNLYDQAESELTVALPQGATNVGAVGADGNYDVQLTVQDNEVTITDTLDFNEQKSYLIKYETPPPEKQETPLVDEGDTLVKSVIVSSTFHYEDVLTYTDIPELSPADAEQDVRLYWVIDGVKKDVTGDPEFNLIFYDTDGDGMYDRMSWIAPHLSTQIFEIVIHSDVDPGSYSSIGLALLSPADGEYITSTSTVGFNYSVSYNASTTVYCNLTVDGTVRRENIPALADTEITTYFNLSSGTHSWNVNCAGSDGSSNMSSTRTFTIDLDTPAIAMNTPDYHVSYASSISLNFTPTDTKYPVLICGLSVNGALNRTGIIATNNTQQTVSLTGMANGVYDWNVSCQDAAGNIGSSEERVFYISVGTPSEYNISPNKNSYSIGEVGYLIMSAPAGSNLTMFVDTPLHDSFFKYYNGRTFPIVEMINFTNNAGTYNIDGIFSNGGNMYIVKTSLQVTSTFSAHIDTNETTGEPGDTFRFEANATGGIGAVTYEWDFDDGNTSNETEVAHTFPSVGEYVVELTATDSRGNTATDTQRINIYDMYELGITVKDLQTGILLNNISVEVDEEKKYTDTHGTANFTVYDGKHRVYVAQTGYDWVKQVRNITEDTYITIELNRTGEIEYPQAQTSAESEASEAETTAKNDAELMLAKVDVAIEGLEATDTATKAVLESLDIKTNLVNIRKELRQMIRDLGNTELSTNLTAEEKQARADEITAKLNGFDNAITSVEVIDTSEFVDYPKASDIAMLSTEYLRYKKIELSEAQKKDYANVNTELQAELTITTRLSTVELNLLSGDKQNAAVVINKLTKSPVEVKDKAIIEYLPKEVATSASDIVQITKFDIVKADPILRFDPSLSSYTYYITKELTIDDLKKTKHVMLYEPSEDARKGLPGVTGFSILGLLKIGNPKLAAEIAIITLLLLAYLIYHFELIDRFKDWRTKKNPAKAPYSTDMAYQPESTLDAIAGKVKAIVKKEDEILTRELSHIRSLMMTAHSHADSRKHEHAHETYKQIMDSYKGLSKEAKNEVHAETKHVYNKVLLTKVHHLLDEAEVHIRNNRHDEAKDHYSEIKQIYTKLEKEHRAAVSERCINLHAAIFEKSLT